MSYQPRPSVRPTALAATWDAIVVGGGHNGLTTGAYLAKAGLRTLILERRHILGGACVTEEVWPGARVSRASYVVSMLQPKVVDDLELKRHGYEAYPLDPAYAAMTPDGPIVFHDDVAKTLRVDREVLQEGRRALRGVRGAPLHGRRLRPADDDPPAPGARLEGARRHRRDPQGGRPHRRHVPARRPEAGPHLHDVASATCSTRSSRTTTSRARSPRPASSASGPAPTPPAPPTTFSTTRSASSTATSARWGQVIGGMGAISEAIASQRPRRRRRDPDRRRGRLDRLVRRPRHRRHARRRHRPHRADRRLGRPPEDHDPRPRRRRATSPTRSPRTWRPTARAAPR